MNYSDTIKKWERRRADIVRHRRSGKSLREIAKIYGITYERVRQILARAAQ